MTKNRTEQLFEKVAREVGLQIHQPHPIRINYPVENRFGEIRKVVTTPDFFVVEPMSGQTAHVEVTNGSGNNSHKHAQQRVVDAAGIDNYIMLTGDQVAMVDQQPTYVEKRSLLIGLLGWYLVD